MDYCVVVTIIQDSCMGKFGKLVQETNVSFLHQKLMQVTGVKLSRQTYTLNTEFITHLSLDSRIAQ